MEGEIVKSARNCLKFTENIDAIYIYYQSQNLNYLYKKCKKKIKNDFLNEKKIIKN